MEGGAYPEAVLFFFLAGDVDADEDTLSSVLRAFNGRFLFSDGFGVAEDGDAPTA